MKSDKENEQSQGLQLETSGAYEGKIKLLSLHKVFDFGQSHAHN